MLGSVSRAHELGYDMRALATLTMEVPLTAQDHDVPRRGVVGFDVKALSAVWCLSGEVWVTGPGLGDRVLQPGESVLVASAGRVVVQGLSPSHIRVLAGARSKA